MNTAVVILAAGKGTRMRSDLPKVLHHLAGRPLLAHVLATAREIAGDPAIVVYGHGGELLPETFAANGAGAGVTWIEQREQLGTGHAVMQALPALDGADRVLVLYGDVPLLTPETLRRLLTDTPEDGVGVLTAVVVEPDGYGRIVRGADGGISRIVEHKDATDEERRIDEINTGIMVMPAEGLSRWLGALGNDNAQGEYYLTDVVGAAATEGLPVRAVRAGSETEVAGVNDRSQLARLERAWQLRNAERLMEAGVTILDPARLDVRGDLEAGPDVVLDVNVVIEGRVTLGPGVRVGPHCVLRDVVVGANSEILEFTSLTESRIGEGARIGPFARLRPGADVADAAHIGNFVEVKKSRIGPGSKVNHLSYVGDAVVGSRVNVGAGTITCNYDGANKYQTVIEDDVFVGSDTQFVAPVTVGAGATIGAGTTVTADVPPAKLVVGRVRQRIVDGWVRPKKSGS